MSLLTQLVNLFFSQRRGEIDFFMQHPARVQQQQLERLLTQAGGTVFGRDHGFGKIRTSEAYAAAVPVVDYDSFSEYIGRTRTGEQNVLWPTEIKWFAKSSGTTSAKSKFIPVSDEGLSGCHLRGPMDVICFFAGLCFGYFLIAPLSVSFFAGYQASPEITNMIDVRSYLSTVLSVSIACAVVFQLPLLVYFLARMGLITASFLRRYRRHALILLCIISAIITPPDIFSLLLVVIPLYGLYECSILLAGRVERQKAREEAAENVAGPAA